MPKTQARQQDPAPYRVDAEAGPDAVARREDAIITSALRILDARIRTGPLMDSPRPDPQPQEHQTARPLKGPAMTADQVRAFVAVKYPGVLESPIAQAMHGASAMLMLEASDADAVALRGEALQHARACLRARSGWTVETLGNNIQSAFGMDLDADECDEIARHALSR